MHQSCPSKDKLILSSLSDKKAKRNHLKLLPCSARMNRAAILAVIAESALQPEYRLRLTCAKNCLGERQGLHVEFSTSQNLQKPFSRHVGYAHVAENGLSGGTVPERIAV